MENLKKFISQSETFGSFDFSGCYSMRSDVFYSIYDYYLKTNINLLDDYSNMVYLGWIDLTNGYSDCEKIKIYQESQFRLRKSGLFDSDWLAQCREKIRYLERLYINYLDRINNEARYIASKEIAKKSVRNEVFALYGKVCLACGSKNNITIDHVIPVSKNGINHISNYQPLCKSCNSKKGDKIIDYRNK